MKPFHVIGRFAGTPLMISCLVRGAVDESDAKNMVKAWAKQKAKIETAYSKEWTWDAQEATLPPELEGFDVYPVLFTQPQTDERGVPQGAELVRSILALPVQSDGYSYWAFGPVTRQNLTTIAANLEDWGDGAEE